MGAALHTAGQKNTLNNTATTATAQAEAQTEILFFIFGPLYFL